MTDATPGLTYPELLALQPCPDALKRVTRKLGGARKWGERRVTVAEARAAGVGLDDLLWVLSTLAKDHPDIERRLRLTAADYAARVLHIFEREHPDDMRVRDCIIASRRFARGEISVAACAAAMDAAWAAACAAWAAASAAACAAASAAASAAAWAAACAAGETWQLDRLIARFSDPEPEDWPLPARQERSAA